MKFADQKLREEEQRGEKYLESFSGSIKNVSGLKLFNFFFGPFTQVGHIWPIKITFK